MYLRDMFTFEIASGASARVSGEGEKALVVLHAGFLQLFLGLAHSGHLRVRVDDSRNDIVVDMTSEPCDILNTRDAFFLRLVCEHRSIDGIADSKDTGNLGLERLVNLDATDLVCLDAQSFQTNVLGERTTSSAHKNHIGLKHGLVSAFRGLQSELDTSGGDLGSNHLGAQLKLHALLLQHFQKVSGSL